MFEVYSSVWFSAIYLLLMLSLVGCFVPRLRVYFTALRARPPQAPRNLSPAGGVRHLDHRREPGRGRRSERGPSCARQRRRVEAYDGDDQLPSSARRRATCARRATCCSTSPSWSCSSASRSTGLYGFKGSVAVVSGDGFSNTLGAVRRLHARRAVRRLVRPRAVLLQGRRLQRLLGPGGCRHGHAAALRRRPVGHRRPRRPALPRTTCGSTTRSRSTAPRSSSSATATRRR